MFWKSFNQVIFLGIFSWRKEIFVTIYVVARKFEVEIFDTDSHISYTDSVEDCSSFMVSDRVVSLIKYMKGE